ncbi:hypothetical protein FHT92_004946 [Rhizobium sp. BK377]|nr:hypothetical protein [Rhizobium sp. BK377]
MPLARAVQNHRNSAFVNGGFQSLNSSRKTLVPRFLAVQSAGPERVTSLNTYSQGGF